MCLNLGREHNFRKWEADTGDLPYDYDSIMHYGAYDFSSNGYPTITPIDNDLSKIGQRKGLSSTDWDHIKRAYCSTP